MSMPMLHNMMSVLTTLNGGSADIDEEDQAVWWRSPDHVFCARLKLDDGVVELGTGPAVTRGVGRRVPIEHLGNVVGHGADAALPPGYQISKNADIDMKWNALPVATFDELHEGVHVHPTTAASCNTLIRHKRHLLLTLPHATVRIDNQRKRQLALAKQTIRCWYRIDRAPLVVVVAHRSRCIGHDRARRQENLRRRTVEQVGLWWLRKQVGSLQGEALLAANAHASELAGELVNATTRLPILRLLLSKAWLLTICGLLTICWSSGISWGLGGREILPLRSLGVGGARGEKAGSSGSCSSCSLVGVVSRLASCGTSVVTPSRVGGPRVGLGLAGCVGTTLARRGLSRGRWGVSAWRRYTAGESICCRGFPGGLICIRICTRELVRVEYMSKRVLHGPMKSQREYCSFLRKLRN
jgi:hypothetical protein